MEGADFNVVMPASASYPPPASLPQGMKQFTLRQVQYNTIPNAAPSGTPGGTEIQVVLPQLDGCFLDPSTTALYVECVYVGSMSIVAGNPIVFSCSNSNGGFVGSGASMFFRYQVWLNNSILSDNIDEFGVVCHLQFLLSLTEQQRYELAVPLGFNKAFPASTWGASFHGTDLTSRATLTPVGHIITANNANTILGTSNSATCNNSSGIFWANNKGSETTIVLNYMQNYNFMLQLPGVLGSGNDKLFPLFNGPTRLSLFMEDISRYYVLDYATGVANFGAQPVPFSTMSGYMSVLSVWFVGDCCRCDTNSFNAVLGALPIPNTFIMRTTAWSVSSSALTATQQGQTDVLIPPRRASIRAVYILPSPSGVNTDLGNGSSMNLWGKYGWCNPNLTNGTCIALNGVNYPQQTTDPLNRPSEIWYNLLKTIQTWSNDANKTCIAPDNFFVCDSLDKVSNAPGSFTHYKAAANNSSAGSALWRPVNTTTFRTNVSATGESFSNFSGANIAKIAVTSGLVTSNGSSVNASINTGVLLAMTDKSQVIGSGVYGTIPGQAHFHEGSSSCDMYGPNSSYLLGMYAPTRPACNQFIYACDFENLAKQQYLSGVSTLTGSFFFRINIATALKYNYSMYFVVVHDSLIVLDTALRTAAVKI